MFRNRSTHALATLALTLALTITAMAGPAVILGGKALAEVKAPPLPAKVSPGAKVAFDVSFKNMSKSNLSQLFLKSTTADATPAGGSFVEIESSSQGSCDSTDGNVDCTLGAVAAGATATVRVVYITPDVKGTFSVPFLFSAPGIAGDPGGNSHGDDYPVDAKVVMDDGKDFAGAYAFGGQIITDIQALHATRNPQFTQVTAPADAIGVGVSVGEATFSCPLSLGTCFGQWSVISVGGGAPYPYGFSVLMGYKGNIGNANFVHLFDGYNATTNPTAYELITYAEDQCPSSSPSVLDIPCMIPSSSGGNSFVTLWLNQNGRLSGY